MCQRSREDSFGTRAEGFLPKLKLARSQLTSTFRSQSSSDMALNPALTTFLTRLDADVGAGTSTQFLASTGRRLVASHVRLGAATRKRKRERKRGSYDTVKTRVDETRQFAHVKFW